MNVSMTVAREFERESHRIDQLIWDAMALRAGETALFCGFGNSLEWIKRAAGIGVAVSVISDDDAAIRELRELSVTVLRGSTSMLPAVDLGYDATIAFHYLHEVDPLFHTNIVSEIARAGKRCVIVEPAPPSDPLGLRIAALYSRAKRELGQFENYHQLEYWRKLLAIVKPNVSCQAFSFLRTPPKEAVRDTVALIIDTMAAEQTPESYLNELRALAARPDAQLVPQARYVIVGTSAAVAAPSTAGTDFRDVPAEEPRRVVAAKRFVPPAMTKAAAGPASAAAAPTVYSSPETEPEFPAVIPPPAPATGAKPASPAAVAAGPPEANPDQIARNAFGLNRVAESAPQIADAGLEDAFGIPDLPAGEAPAEFGWAWEPPESAG